MHRQDPASPAERRFLCIEIEPKATHAGGNMRNGKRMGPNITLLSKLLILKKSPFVKKNHVG